MKFGSYQDGNETEHAYRNAAERIRYRDGTECLLVTSEGSLTDLMKELGRCLPGDWYFLYVLLITHTEDQPGRYQSPPIECYDGVSALLDQYKPFLDGDGRHHLWLGSTTGAGTIVYDNHNRLFCYGPLAALLERLRSFSAGTISIPTPHTHHYQAEFAERQRALLREWEWRWFPLQDDDDP